MSDDMIKQMTEKFLQWELPNDFSPDGGISFNPPSNPNHPRPVGTNLLTFTQAEEMVRFIAADHIEALEAKLALAADALEALPQVLENALWVEMNSYYATSSDAGEELSNSRKTVISTLATLKGDTE